MNENQLSIMMKEMGYDKITHKIEGNKLVIDFDIKSKEVSKSGKTILLATSNGFV